jgi:hypothetical protein
MTNETWTDHASKALQGFLHVLARFLMAILPQVAVSLGLLLLCAILPSTLNLKLKLNIAYKSDFVESTRDAVAPSNLARPDISSGLYNDGAFSNDNYNRFDTTTENARVLPFLPDSDERIHMYDGFEHSAVFSPDTLLNGQIYAKYALALGGPAMATGSPIRFGRRAPGLSPSSANAAGGATFGFASFLVPLCFYIILFAVFAGFRFCFRKKLAFFKLVLTLVFFWILYGLTAGAVAAYNAAELVDAVMGRFQLRLAPVLPLLLLPPILILIAALVYYGAASLLRHTPAEPVDPTDPRDESVQETDPITGDVG